jgi:hypothetical protein
MFWKNSYNIITRIKNQILMHLLKQAGGCPERFIFNHIISKNGKATLKTQFDQSLHELENEGYVVIRKISDDKGLTYLLTDKISANGDEKYMLTGKGIQFARPGLSLFYRKRPYQRDIFNKRLKGVSGVVVKSAFDSMIKSNHHKTK